MIYVIGDSQAGLFNGYEGLIKHDQIQPQYGYDYKLENSKFICLHNKGQNKFHSFDKNFMSIRTGANTAYNMFNKIDLVDEIVKEYNIDKKKDQILFCYGEIDTRVHIGMQEDNGKHLNEIITEITNRYFKFVNYYKDKGYSVIVWGVIPGGLSGGGAHPNYALPENRNRASKLMNELFYKKCNELNIEFISIWEDLIKIDNYYDYFIDSIHLSYSACKSLLYLKFKDYING